MMNEQIIFAANMVPPRHYTGIGSQFLILVLLLIIIVWLLKDSKKTPYKVTEGDTALDILKKRYASGEITKEQYEDIKKDIGEKDSTPEPKPKPENKEHPDTAKKSPAKKDQQESIKKENGEI